MATTAMLTSCQQNADAAGDSGDSGKSASDSPSKGGASDNAGGNGGGNNSDNSSSTGGSGGSSTGGGASGGVASGRGASGGGASSGSGMSATFHGVVKYVAPGKFTVPNKGQGDQAFFTSNKTDVQGHGVICGAAQGPRKACTESQLETAAKKGLTATVKMVKGTATVIRDERTTGANGQSGHRSGKLSRESGSSYYVTDSDGAKTPFVLHGLTTINGAGQICGSENTTAFCTTKELNTAAEKGVQVVVDLDHGTALNIDEEHN